MTTRSMSPPGPPRGCALALLTGCGLLDTETPDIIQPGNVESPAGAQARRAGALADWAFVRDGDGTEFVDGEILLTGLMADEFVLSTTPPGEQEIDQRKISLLNTGIDSLFLLMHRVRAEAEDAAGAIQRLSTEPATEDRDPRDAGRGRLHLHLLR